ncbi:MAG: hypothetical protein MJE63_05740 [Proteobacteria bacterium]|nr:hypothetical protein [Pseudomonadota bacterium]
MTVCIVSYGMQSPTGTSASMSIANVIAGIARTVRFNSIEDMRFNPVTLGMAQYLPDDSPNSGRISQLMAPALEETLKDFSKEDLGTRPIKIYIGIPRHRPGLDMSIESLLGQSLEILKLQKSLNLEWSFIRENHDSGCIALMHAMEDLETKTCRFAVIGGVDSFVSEETVEWLEKEKYLKCSTNPKGFTPGEAASFCLLCSEQTANELNLPIKGKVLKSATKKEPHLPGAESPTSGKGLSQAIESVLQTLPEDQQIDETFCTLKGLRHEAEEFSFTIPRTGFRFTSPGTFTTLVPNWGDIGAASAPALICYALEKRSLEFSEPGYNLIFTQSPGSSRSAALIQTL